MTTSPMTAPVAGSPADIAEPATGASTPATPPDLIEAGVRSGALRLTVIPLPAADCRGGIITDG